nr:hypothetical protein JVH1_0966 [Rhodococcus sp. JVH1]
MRLPFEAARVSLGQHRKSSRRTTGFGSRRSDLQWLTTNGAATSPRKSWRFEFFSCVAEWAVIRGDRERRG